MKGPNRSWSIAGVGTETGPLSREKPDCRRTQEAGWDSLAFTGVGVPVRQLLTSARFGWKTGWLLGGGVECSTPKVTVHSVTINSGGAGRELRETVLTNVQNPERISVDFKIKTICVPLPVLRDENHLV